MKFCVKCGTQLEDAANFCYACGAPQAAKPTPAEAAQPIQPVQPAAPVNQAAVGNTLYMDAKGLTLFNYKFDIKDAAGNLRYRAATVTESMIRYNARIYYPDDSEAMAIHQQSKLTFAAMNFDIVAPNGQLLTPINQIIHMTRSEFQLPGYGITLEGDFFSLNFVFKREGRIIGAVEKKLLAWGDCYALSFEDPSLELIFLSAIMAVQMVIAASRSRRRRR